MCTRMIHPEHGATHAYGRGEIEQLERFGWRIEVEVNTIALVDAPTESKAKSRPVKAKTKTKTIAQPEVEVEFSTLTAEDPASLD